MQRHRRASSASTSTSSDNNKGLSLSRSSSTASIRQSPSILASTSPSLSPIESARSGGGGGVTAMVLDFDPLQVVVGGSQRQEKRRSVI